MLPQGLPTFPKPSKTPILHPLKALLTETEDFASNFIACTFALIKAGNIAIPNSRNSINKAKPATEAGKHPRTLTPEAHKYLAHPFLEPRQKHKFDAFLEMELPTPTLVPQISLVRPQEGGFEKDNQSVSQSRDIVVEPAIPKRVIPIQTIQPEEKLADLGEIEKWSKENSVDKSLPSENLNLESVGSFQFDLQMLTRRKSSFHFEEQGLSLKKEIKKNSEK